MHPMPCFGWKACCTFNIQTICQIPLENDSDVEILLKHGWWWPFRSHSPFWTYVLISPLSLANWKSSWMGKLQIKLQLVQYFEKNYHSHWTRCTSSCRTSSRSSGRRRGTRWCRSCTWTWICPAGCRCTSPPTSPPRSSDMSRQMPHSHWGQRRYKTFGVLQEM